MRTLAALLCVVMLAACAGVGIPLTDDPDAKLAMATTLVDDGRVLQARRQTEEAIAIFEQRGDRAGLARAYRVYALVAVSGGLNADAVVLRKTPPHPGREELEHAEEYLNRAAPLAAETGQPYLVARITLMLGSSQYVRGNHREACTLFDRAIDQWRAAEAEQPGVASQMTPGTRDFPGAVARIKATVPCS
jgi:tetratricopeptide (TPR) repeat protein